jgi:hypothetical protein
MMLGCSDSRNHDSKSEENSSISSSDPSENNASTSDQTSFEQSAGDVNGSSSDDNITSAVDPTLQSLALNIAAEELPENSETNVSVRATYIGGRVTAPRTDIIWHISDTNIVEINNSKLLAKAEGAVTIRAEVGGKLSPEKSITVYKIIHGHRLPPEPAPQINNSTLLGIDSNNNGVRDDVERWIYSRYDTYIPCKEVVVEVPGTDIKGTRDVCEETPVPYHQIVREIAMQFGRAAQIVIQEPEKARKTMKYMDAAVDCNGYFRVWAKYNNEPILVDHYIFGDEFKDVQFNTAKRVRAFAEYNQALSGGVYEGLGFSHEYRDQCDFDVNKLLAKKNEEPCSLVPIIPMGTHMRRPYALTPTLRECGCRIWGSRPHR